MEEVVVHRVKARVKVEKFIWSWGAWNWREDSAPAPGSPRPFYFRMLAKM